jgi:hypothetical protein
MNNNYDEIDRLMFEYFNKYNSIPKNIEHTIDAAMYEKNKKCGLATKVRRLVISILGLMTITGGIVFAKEIEEFIKNIFNDKSGVEIASENGYTYENAVSSSSSSQNIKISTKNLLMDDYTFKINILAEFDKNIDLTNIKKVYTPDIFFIDENNNVLSSSVNLNSAKHFFQEKGVNNCDNEFIINHSINSTLDSGYEKINKNTIMLTYNSSIADGKFPKSKKVYVGFNTLILKDGETLSSEAQTITGNWLIEVEVPQKFKNRESINYHVVNCNDANVDKDSIIANVSETGMKFEMKMYWGDYEYWHEKTEKLRKEGNILDSQLIRQEDVFIENENGEKYFTSLTSGENGYSLSKDGELSKTDTFNITKYNLTNKLKVVYPTIDNRQIIIEVQKSE